MSKTEDEAVSDEEMMRRKIVHILTVFPCISSTMLQMGLGPHVKPDIWRPRLTELLEKGTVVSDTVSVLTPVGRHQSYTKLSLATTVAAVVSDA